ncbi:hypothetical protein ABZ816_34620 [Actinosynnema sp. NPDC047251]|uniref:Putative secreted protein n=1 Tax=Saccharothrix espanaensis (strain ATCC 51144 / DSM 44229 / JCM 9112 / NBRC 15066 / NRRL 15764) TaxID=1179773 RepID=K0JWG7_SACES|nr:hypothetical protein [Saccharothrix espanaensis]CCH32165.1 putative secreted protein [Saccharothrix espanaensis DSM 44229]
MPKNTTANRPRRIGTLVGAALLSALAVGAPEADAAAGEPTGSATSGAHLAAPFRVTAATHADVLDRATRNGAKWKDKVTAGHGYDAYCYVRGESINGNTLWIKQLGDGRNQGYLPAAYLRNGAAGAGVSTMCG